MIPFARVLNYGNKAPAPVVNKYKKIDCSYSCTIVLGKTGNLYYFGSPAAGEIPSSTSVKTLFATDVADCAIAAQNTVYLTNGGSFIFYGNNTAFGGTPVANVSNVDITDKFTTVGPVDNIKKFMVNYGTIYMLTKDGDLYGIGSNSSGQLGIGSNTALYSNFTLIRSSVDDFTCNKNYGLFVLSGGVIYACGSGQDIGVGIGSGSKQITLTPIVLSGAVNGSFGTTLDGVLSTTRSGAVVFSQSTNKLFSCGYRGGAFNNNSATSASPPNAASSIFTAVVMTNSTGDALEYKGKMWSGSGDPYFPIILMSKSDGSGLGYYFSASNDAGIYGTGEAVYQTRMKLAGVSRNADCVNFQRGALYYSSGDYFMAAGNSSNNSIPGFTGNQYYFITPVGFAVNDIV